MPGPFLIRLHKRCTKVPFGQRCLRRRTLTPYATHTIWPPQQGSRRASFSSVLPKSWSESRGSLAFQATEFDVSSNEVDHAS